MSFLYILSNNPQTKRLNFWDFADEIFAIVIKTFPV